MSEDFDPKAFIAAIDQFMIDVYRTGDPNSFTGASHADKAGIVHPAMYLPPCPKGISQAEWEKYGPWTTEIPEWWPSK